MLTVSRFRFLMFLWPFRGALFLGSLIVLWLLSFFSMKSIEANQSTSMLEFLVLLILIPSFVLVIISFLLLVISWCFLFFQRKKIQFESKGDTFILQPIFRPLLGSLHLRLKRNQNWDQQTMVMLPDNSAKWQWGMISMVAQKACSVPSIRVESVEGIMLHIDDVFHFFTLTVFLPLNYAYYRKPSNNDQRYNELIRLKEDQEGTQLTSRKKQRDELFQLKLFEPGDDVRRIAWKLLAKHNTLMVRKPDIDRVYAKETQVLILFDFNLMDIQYPDLVVYFEAIYKQQVYSMLCGMLDKEMPITLSMDGSIWHPISSKIQLSLLITEADYSRTLEQGTNTVHAFNGMVFMSSLTHRRVLNHLSLSNINWILIDLFKSLEVKDDLIWGESLVLRPKNSVFDRLVYQWQMYSKRKETLLAFNSLKQQLQQQGPHGYVAK